MSFVSAAFAAEDAAFELEFSADRSEVTLGDEISLTAVVTHPKDVKLTPLELPDKLGVFEVKRVEGIPPRPSGGAVKEGWRVIVTAFELGEHSVPSFEIKFVDGQGRPGKVATEEVKVRVGSIGRTEKDISDIRPIKSPYRLGRPLASSLGWIALFLLLLAACGAAVYYWLKRAPLEDPESRLPPDERALLRFERLRGKGYHETGQAKLFYTELADILEKYFREQLKLGSQDQTTEELLDEVRKSNLSWEAQGWIRKVLQLADLAKFAKAQPPKQESEDALATAERIVQETRPKTEIPETKP